jgi:putative transposase
MRTRIGSQLQLALPTTWGGRRKGAGRKPRPGQPMMTRDARPPHEARCPVQVTLRAAARTPSLRSATAFAAIRRALAAASHGGFRVVHFSVQQDHMHLIVEAVDRTRLRRGIQGLAIRIALAVNRASGRRGKLWGDRYHARMLQTPREVRTAMVYVLMNFRKHLRAPAVIDPCSSGPYSPIWVARGVYAAPDPIPVVPPATWLARVGWLRAGGQLRTSERPAQ